MRERARHVITENARVMAARQAMLVKNPIELGIMMDVSHDSLDEYYEVTCPELNLLVKLARDCKGVYGSRMTGGGFGGCTVNLVQRDNVSEFKARVADCFRGRFGERPAVYVCESADAAGEVVSDR